MPDQEIATRLEPLIQEFEVIEGDVKTRMGDLIRMRFQQGKICLQILTELGWDGLEDMAAKVNFTPHYLYNLGMMAKKYTNNMLEEAIGKGFTIRKLIQSSRDVSEKRFSRRAIASLVNDIENKTARLSEMVDEIGGNPDVDGEVLKAEFEKLKEELNGQHRETLLRVLFQIEQTADTVSKSIKLGLYEELKGVIRLLISTQGE